jgi:hypothetical protein
MAEYSDIYDVSERVSPLSVKVSEIKNMNDNVGIIYQNQFKYGNRDTGIRNMDTRSHIKIHDNGNIEMFNGDSAGIFINSKHKTVNTYGQGFNVCAPVAMINTKPGGLIWNGYQLNSRLYQLTDMINSNRSTSIIDDLYVKCSVRYWNTGGKQGPHWDRKEMELKPFFKLMKDEEYTKLLQEVGIPI